MKKIILTILLIILSTNISYAKFSMPKLSTHNSEVSTKEKSVSKNTKDKVEKVETKKVKKDSNKKTIINPKVNTTKVEKSKSNTNKNKNVQSKPAKQITKDSNNEELKLNKSTKKVNIKNPFKKEKVSVGEDMVSKEQVKEELERVHNLSQQAVALYNDNNLDESLNTFLKIPEKYRTAQDNLLIGNILLDLGRREDAIFMYKRAILVDEYYYKPYYNIANICLNDDKYFMAIDYYKKAIRYAPEFPYAYYNLACAYIKAGDLRRAKSNLIKAIDLKNTEPDFHYNLAYVYKKLEKPKLANVYLENYNKLTNGQ